MAASPPDRRRRAVGAALPWVAWAVVRSTGTERGFPLVPALTFTPYAAATAVLPLALALRWRSRAGVLLSAGAGTTLAAVVLARRSRSSATLLARRSRSSATLLARPSRSSATLLARPSRSSATLLARRSRSSATVLARRSRSSATLLARPSRSSATVDSAGERLRVATVSLRLGLVPAAPVLDLLRDQDIDVLVVQELTPDAERRLRAAGIGTLLPHSEVRHARAGSDPAAGGGVWSRRPLRQAGGVPGGFEQPTIRLAGADVDSPEVEVTAVHLWPPATSPASVRQWAADLAALPAPGPGVLRVLAGDFNASLDHAALRRVLRLGYTDAARAAGRGASWTWAPMRFRFPRLVIDHVLVDPRIGVAAADVLPVRGSDHRAVVAELVLPRR